MTTIDSNLLDSGVTTQVLMISGIDDFTCSESLESLSTAVSKSDLAFCRSFSISGIFFTRLAASLLEKKNSQ